MSGDQITLEAVTDIRGDFHRRRGPLAWEPGMLYCCLLDDSQRILAEETLPAPDQVCVVLDPHGNADTAPQPVRFTPEGPVVFQVRMPKIDAATQMKIYRLAGPRGTTFNGEPEGALLATIPLTR